MIDANSPVVFISYDEPNADENFEHLQTIVPKALRVHAVKGFDRAHKAAVEEALEVNPDATHIFTVDGDNKLLKREWALLLKAIAAAPVETHEKFSSKVLSWRAINNVNGLAYGNGGLKLWPVKWIQEMRTHEVSVGDTKVDFCWDRDYIQLSAIISQTLINGSPYQAWRSGFREGVKMTLSAGEAQTRFEIADQVKQVNMRRYMAWATLGRDVEFGEWSILGALMGFALAHEKTSNVAKIIDYDSFFPDAWERLLSSFGILDASAILPSQSIDMKDFMIDLRTSLRVFNVDIPSYGELQSRTCKCWMDYKQPTNLLEVETWDQRTVHLES